MGLQKKAQIEDKSGHFKLGDRVFVIERDLMPSQYQVAGVRLVVSGEELELFYELVQPGQILDRNAKRDVFSESVVFRNLADLRKAINDRLDALR